MTFFRSILLLAAICLCIAFVYFFGYGLALHHTMPMLYGAALLVVGIAIILFLSRDRVKHW